MHGQYMRVLFFVYCANVTCCSALNVCSVELLLKIGTLLMEMLSYEKTLDSFIDLLRKDEVSLCTNFPLITCMQFTLAKHVLFLVR